MAADGYVTIHRTTDAAQGELLAETLRSEGIDARFHRVSSALIGIPTLMIEMTVDVPAKSEARARELLRDLEYLGASASATVSEGDGAAAGGPAGAGQGGEGDETDEAAGGPVEAGRSRRNPLLAPGFAFLLPGGAHLYARRPWTALVVALGLVGCLLGIFAGGRSDVELVGAIGIVLALGDAIGSVRATRRENRGLKATRGRQVAAGFGLLGAAVAVGGTTLHLSASSQQRQLADYKVRCTGDAIIIENGTAETRVIQLANLQISAQSVAGYESYDIATVGPGVLHLAPGGRGVVKANIADWLDRSCGFGFAPEPPKGGFAVEGVDPPAALAPRVESCGLRFEFFAREEGSAESAGLDARGACVPPKATRHEAAGTLSARR